MLLSPAYKTRWQGLRRRWRPRCQKYQFMRVLPHFLQANEGTQRTAEEIHYAGEILSSFWRTFDLQEVQLALKDCQNPKGNSA